MKIPSELNKIEIQVNTKGDRCIVNTIFLVPTQKMWSYDLMFCFGNACGANPFDENVLHKSKESALIVALKDLLQIHTEALKQAGDVLKNYNEKIY